jgi:ankyrin repeat protein
MAEQYELDEELLVAAYLGNVIPGSKLIEQGANVNFQSGNGDTPLHRAASKGRSEFCDLLISAGADVMPLNKSGATPLHKAALAEHNANLVCAALVKAGASARIANSRGATPLHIAASLGQESHAVTVLIEAGADLDARDVAGRTPLHEAAEYGSPGPCEILIKAGADFGALDVRGRTPIELATDGSVKDAIRAAISKVEMKALEKSTGETVKRKRVQKPAPVQSMSI